MEASTGGGEGRSRGVDVPHFSFLKEPLATRAACPLLCSPRLLPGRLGVWMDVVVWVR